MNSGERLRLIFGFLTLAIIAAIAVLIAMGKVEQESSFGLEPILVALTSIAAAFCNWAFAREPNAREPKALLPKDEEKKEP